MQNRVVFVSLGLALLSPATVGGQSEPSRTVRVGYLATHPPLGFAPIRQAFVDQLREHGWSEGRNLLLDLRHADGRLDRLERLARDLAGQPVDVIVASGTSAVLAAQRATRTVPIVIAGASDPVGFGLVRTLAHPGGNVTGLADTPGREIEGKRLQLLTELLPGVRRVAVVLDSSGRRDPGPIESAAKALGLTVLVSRETTNPAEFRRTFAEMRRDGAQAMYAPETPVNAEHRDLIVRLAAEHGLPAIYGSREFVEAGGLMSYGASYPELHRRVADYVDKILRGARPADLPVEQPARLELALSLRVAAGLGLRVPEALLLRADHVAR